MKIFHYIIFYYIIDSIKMYINVTINKKIINEVIFKKKNIN